MEWRGAYRQVPPSFHPHVAGRTSCSAGCVAHGASGGREDVCDMAGSWTPGRTPLCLYDDAPTLFDSQFPADERHFSCLSFLPVWCRILALQDDTTASDWIALGYASKTKIVVKAKGDTGYDGLMEICDENAVLFCLLRLIDGPSLHLSPPQAHAHPIRESWSISLGRSRSLHPVVVCPGRVFTLSFASSRQV